MAWNAAGSIKGPTGATGSQGPQGNPGTAATVAVGTTNTLSPGSAATVTNSGTSNAAVFNFGIPQGQVGATGSQGAQGNPGTAGKSAYTSTSAQFTVPSVGSTVVVSVSDTSWATVGEFVWIAGAAGGGNAGTMKITAIGSATQLTLQA